MKYRIFIIVLFTGLCTYGQDVYLSNGKKQFLLEINSCIGLKTKNDTIEYFVRENSERYRIYKTTSDSLILIRPNEFQDTIVDYDAIYNRTLDFKYVMDEYFKKDKVLYCSIRRIIGYEYRNYHYKDLTYIKYYRSTKNGGDGASFIPFIDFPIKIISNINSNYDLTKKWKIVVEE